MCFSGQGLPAIRPLLSLACGGNPGTPKPGSEGLINFGSLAVQGILSELTEGISEAAFVILFGGLTFNGTAFCGQGDVGDPGMSAQDWSDAVDYTNPVVNLPARIKAQQWFEHVIFPLVCDCSDGTAPPPPVTTGPPPVTTSPNTSPAPVGANCWDHSSTKTSSAPNTPLTWEDTLPEVTPTWSGAFAGVVGIQQPTPASITTTMTVGTEGTNPLAMQYQLTFYNSTGQVITGGGQVSNIQPGSGPQARNWAVPATAANWAIGSENNVGGATVATNRITMEATIYCAGQTPTTLLTPCCPPDPLVDQRLSAIMDMLTALLSEQSLAGKYQDTVRHAGLTGSGTININGATSAIRVEVKNDLSTWPQNPQTPTYYWSLGFITPVADGVPAKGTRLVYAQQLFEYLTFTDQISYALASSVQIDIVELTQGA